MQKLLEQYDAGHFDEFTFEASFGGSGFHYNGVRTIEATPHQMRALMNARVISAEIFDDGTSATCSLNEPMARDVMRQMDAQREQRILGAIYDLAKGNSLNKVAASDIIKRARVTESDFQSAMMGFGERGDVTAHSGAGGPFIYITARGAQRVRGAGGGGKTSGAAVNINQLHMHGSAFNVGDGNTINLQANQGIDPAQALEMLRIQSADMVAQMEVVQNLLPQMIADLKDGKDKEPGWADRLLKLIEAGGKIAEFGSKIMDFGKPV